MNAFMLHESILNEIERFKVAAETNEVDILRFYQRMNYWFIEFYQEETNILQNMRGLKQLKLLIIDQQKKTTFPG